MRHDLTMRIARSYTLFAAIAWFVVAGVQMSASEERAAVLAMVAGLSFLVSWWLQEKARTKKLGIDPD